MTDEYATPRKKGVFSVPTCIRTKPKIESTAKPKSKLVAFRLSVLV